jgi:hypothetical protein
MAGKMPKAYSPFVYGQNSVKLALGWKSSRKSNSRFHPSFVVNFVVNFL